VARAHAGVRRLVPPLERDRALSADIERLALAIQSGEISPSSSMS
jgi:histidine ammonia-lyase